MFVIKELEMDLLYKVLIPLNSGLMFVCNGWQSSPTTRLNPFEFRADVCQRQARHLFNRRVLIPLNSGLMFVLITVYAATALVS